MNYSSASGSQTPPERADKVNVVLTQIAEKCEICARRQATTYMVARGEMITAKGFVCMDCFQACQNTISGLVEAVSLQDYREITDDRLSTEGDDE